MNKMKTYGLGKYFANDGTKNLISKTQTAHPTQINKNQPNQKMSRRSKQTFLQRKTVIVTVCVFSRVQT